MRGFLTALQFLTILGSRKDASTDAENLSSSTVYFPLVGAFLGIALIILNKILGKVFAEPLLSLCLITGLIIITGGLHLDGLADTMDALASRKSKEEMLTIMRDSSKGTFGVLALILVILFKISSLWQIPLVYRNFGLFLMPILSRYSMVFAISIFAYARGAGKAKVFFEEKRPGHLFLATIITLLLLGFTLRWISLVIFFLVISLTLIIGLIIKRRIDGLTGDTLGAICELNELFVLCYLTTVAI